MSIKFSQQLIWDATAAELKFMDIARKKSLRLEFQYPIYIYNGKQIVKFYIADFCDVKNRIIFEIDGGYHFDEWQRELDSIRDRTLRKQGYRVYRISNEDVMLGKSTAFIYKAYMNVDPRFKLPAENCRVLM